MLGRDQVGEFVDAHHHPTGSDASVTAHRQHVADLPGVQYVPQIRVGAIDLVDGHSGIGDPGVESTLEQSGGECGFGGEV